MRGDRGSVALELALTLPAVVAVLALCLSAVRVAAVSGTVEAAALAGARAAAIGTDVQAGDAARRVAGGLPGGVAGGVDVEVARSQGWVTVTVSVDVPWPWPRHEAQVALPEEP